MKKVLIIFGGISSEHDVSCLSAASIVSNMDADSFDIRCVGITEEGSWLLTEADSGLIKSGDWKYNKSNKAVFLSTDRTRKGLFCWEDANKALFIPDCIFPVLHGEYGEDGMIQGIFEYAGIPYVGPGVMSSAVSLDKAITKKIVAGLDVKQADYLEFRYDELEIENQSKVIAKHFDRRYPIFIKPANAGSSLGVSKVKNSNEIKPALLEAFKYCKKVIVEEGLTGREIEVAILQGDSTLASGLGEIISLDKFYSFDEKYKDSDRTKVALVKDLDEAIVSEIQNQAKKIFATLECKSLSRVDFFYTSEGQIYFNEINTLPGFTEHSMYPKLIMEQGFTYAELLTNLIENAIEASKVRA